LGEIPHAHELDKCIYAYLCINSGLMECLYCVEECIMPEVVMTVEDVDIGLLGCNFVWTSGLKIDTACSSET
jgi:hypothetical protein